MPRTVLDRKRTGAYREDCPHINKNKKGDSDGDFLSQIVHLHAYVVGKRITSSNVGDETNLGRFSVKYCVTKQSRLYLFRLNK
jgi:hypothetical protein